ncbi:MAG: phosphate acyltransferase PlsX [candidate division WOR-3 bacterium]|nr:phosphate acyltransferase PlsX [candidate division WOR-3 bacterium]
MRIAVDAMGGDNAPGEIIKGAIEAAKTGKGTFEVVLVGDKNILKKHIEFLKVEIPVKIINAPEIIDADELPTVALKKTNSSISIAAELQKKGEIDAFISAGNTGAVMAFSLLTLGRIEGVSRPALGAFFPTKKGFTMVLDVGANSDCNPTYLLQFGIIGHIIAEGILEKDKPKIGLLNIGKENKKGNKLVRKAYALLEKAPINFIGNIEGMDIMNGKCDVVVCDGFTGNIILKFGEGLINLIFDTIKSYIGSNWQQKLSVLFPKSPVSSFVKRMSYDEYGGAPLLDVDGITIVCHGRSNAKAITNAIFTAKRFKEARINDLIRETFSRVIEG